MCLLIQNLLLYWVCYLFHIHAKNQRGNADIIVVYGSKWKEGDDKLMSKTILVSELRLCLKKTQIKQNK